MNSTRFSIIIPIYNVEKYIEECIESVINQTFNDYEVIMVDDGSVDNSGIIADRYSEKDNRFRVIHKNNEGLLKARLSGFSIANGEYILSLDSDDFWKPTLLEQVDLCIRETMSDVVVYNFVKTDGNKEIEVPPCFDRCQIFKKDKVSYITEWAKNSNLNAMWSKAFKRSVFVWEHDEAIEKVMSGEDLLLSIPIIKNASSIAYLPSALYCYRQNLYGISNSFNKNKINDLLISRTRFQQFISVFNSNVLKNFEVSTLKTIGGTISAICISRVDNKRDLLSLIRESNLYSSLDKNNISNIDSHHLRGLLRLFEGRAYCLINLLEQILCRINKR